MCVRLNHRFRGRGPEASLNPGARPGPFDRPDFSFYLLMAVMNLTVAGYKLANKGIQLCVIILLLCSIFFPASGTTAPQSIEKTVEAYLRVFPDAKSIGVIYSQDALEKTVRQLETIAKARKIKVVSSRIPSIKEFPAAVKELKDQVDTFWVLDDPLYSSQEAWSFFIFFTIRNKLRTVVSTEKGLKDCGLFYFSGDKEAVVNKRMLDILGAKVSGNAGEVRYYVPTP